MCTIAAYIGDERAAPLLIEMLRRQEGFDAGFSTGIATVADGILHMRKVEGSVDELLRRTDAADLPGSIGMIHGRTPGSGGDEWAHPFLACGGKFALCENGCTGAFTDTDRFHRMARELEAEGHTFRSQTSEAGEGHCQLADGTWVHYSDMVTHNIGRAITAHGDDIARGMTAAFNVIPVEIVAVLLHAEHADRLFFTRINMPMTIGRNGREVFAASAPFALPKDRGINWSAVLPTYATSVVSRAGIEVIPLTDIRIPVDRDIPWHAGEEAIVKALEENGPMTMGVLRSRINHIWQQGLLAQKGYFLYQLLPDMERRGVIRFENTQIPGNHPPLKAPAVMIRLAR